jgi:hypothetical protein
VKDSPTPAAGRGGSLHPEFVRAATSLAIARAARDGHRSACEYDAQDCPKCRELVAAVRLAKEGLRAAPAV